MPVVVQMALFVDTHELLRQVVRDQTRSTNTEQIDRACPLKTGARRSKTV